MRIFDCFTFYNELDILELRLEILYNYVDRFVIVEADHTFTSKPKEFNLEKNWDRFKKWHNKITYIKASSPKNSNAWDNESWQRNQMIHGLVDITAEDVIIVSDVDEIIRPTAIDVIKNTKYDWYGLMMPAFYFKFNYLDTKPNWHYKPWAKAYRGNFLSPQQMRSLNTEHLTDRSCALLHHGGWHFGWLGDENFAKNKIKSFSHTELDNKIILDNINIDKHISEGTDHFRLESTTWVPVKLDDYFPREILDHNDKYAPFILTNGDKSVRDYWTASILQIEETQ